MLAGLFHCPPTAAPRLLNPLPLPPACLPHCPRAGDLRLSAEPGGGRGIRRGPVGRYIPALLHGALLRPRGTIASSPNVMYASILSSNKPPYCRLSNDTQSWYLMGITMGITGIHSHHAV